MEIHEDSTHRTVNSIEPWLWIRSRSYLPTARPVNRDIFHPYNDVSEGAEGLLVPESLYPTYPIQLLATQYNINNIT